MTRTTHIARSTRRLLVATTLALTTALFGGAVQGSPAAHARSIPSQFHSLAFSKGEGSGPGYCGSYRGGYNLSNGQASFENVYACGPRPGNCRANGNPFDSCGYQCVELVDRYMWVTHGEYVAPTDGWDLVTNFARKYGIAQSAPGPGRVPAPGDVVSEGTRFPGHTAIVTGVSVDAQGNGSITLLQENATKSGWGAIRVRNWNETGIFTVTGWLQLHDSPPPLTSKADIVAVEPQSAGGVNYMLGLSQGDGNFTWKFSNLTKWARPVQVALGDVNGDGKADIVATEPQANGTVNYMLGLSQGNGKFAWSATNLTNMTRPVQMALADINGDGKADIVAAEPQAGGGVNYMIGLSQGNGNFTWMYSNLTHWATPVQMTLGDVNGDHKADLLVTEPRSGSGVNYMVGISQGNGKFAWSDTNLTGMTAPAQMALGDLNGDGKADIVAAEPQSGGGVNYMVGISQGNGTFTWMYSNLRHFATPVQMALGDVNGDGKADLVVTEPQSNGTVNYMVGLSQGDGTFAWKSSNLTGMTTPTQMALGAINGG